MRVDAFTVGNPERYEPTIRRERAAGRAVCKAVGGVAFRTADEAEAILEDGHLPAAWFPDCPDLPGRVYRILLPASFDECTELRDGLHALTVDVPLALSCEDPDT